MKPIIKAIISPDISDFPTFSPMELDNFGFLLQLLIGPAGEESMESFAVMVCSPKWLYEKYGNMKVIAGRHHLIMFEYNYDSLIDTINAYVEECSGRDWKEVALKLARFGKWEFEDYYIL